MNKRSHRRKKRARALRRIRRAQLAGFEWTALRVAPADAARLLAGLRAGEPPGIRHHDEIEDVLTADEALDDHSDCALCAWLDDMQDAGRIADGPSGPTLVDPHFKTRVLH